MHSGYQSLILNSFTRYNANALTIKK